MVGDRRRGPLNIVPRQPVNIVEGQVTKQQRQAYIDELIKAIVDGKLTADDLKAEPKPKNRRLRADAVNIEPIVVTLKAMKNVEPWKQALTDEDGKVVRDKNNAIVYTEVGRIFKANVTTKGEPKDAKVFVSGVYVKAEDMKRFNPRARIEVEVKPEVMPNRDDSAKHSRGGNIKTRNLVVLDGAGKFYVNGYFPVQR